MYRNANLSVYVARKYDVAGSDRFGSAARPTALDAGNDAIELIRESVMSCTGATPISAPFFNVNYLRPGLLTLLGAAPRRNLSLSRSHQGMMTCYTGCSHQI
jgi:hypothetical protein